MCSQVFRTALLQEPTKKYLMVQQENGGLALTGVASQSSLNSESLALSADSTVIHTYPRASGSM
jgi:hypothetical protein